MRLLLINQFFWPDAAPTGRFLLDVARAAEAQQREANQIEVTAICGASGYATTDDTPRPPVRILRPPATRFSRDAVGRILSYGSFLAGALVAGFRVGRPDTVVTLTTPPLTSVFGRMLKLSRGCRHFIWEMDVYPDIAVDLGALQPRSLFTCLIGALADWSRRNADGIIVLGEEMKARLIARDIPEHKIHVAENWADGTEITPLPFPKGPLVVHYSGNFGLAHDFDTISAVISGYANDPRFQFVFAGGGSPPPAIGEPLPRARHRQRGIPPVLLSRRSWRRALAEGHLGLVTQLPQTCGSIVPSKTYGILGRGPPAPLHRSARGNARQNDPALPLRLASGSRRYRHPHQSARKTCRRAPFDLGGGKARAPSLRTVPRPEHGSGTHRKDPGPGTGWPRTLSDSRKTAVAS